MSNEIQSESKRPKMILVDDDPVFGSIMQKEAQVMGYELDYYDSLSSLGFISQLANYDIIIVDFQMDHINGIEIAAYMPSFFSDKTVILVSNTEIGEQIGQSLPEYITQFIHKNNGSEGIIKQAVDVFDVTQQKVAS